MATHQEFHWQAGDHVLAPWPADGFHYPARVVEAQGEGTLLVAYDDGQSASVSAGEVFPLDLGVEARVFARWGGGEIYFPGLIDQVDGDRLHVRYDDGDEEWTTLD